jgi:acyl carrier protein
VYRIPVASALNVRYSATRKKNLPSVSRIEATAVPEKLDGRQTRAETLAWIAGELLTGDAIQNTIVNSKRKDHASREFLPPRTSSERQIAEIWAEMLGVTNVGIRDNFFQIGGDSLAMVRVILRVHELTGYELPVRAFFEAPTIEEQLLNFPIGEQNGGR